MSDEWQTICLRQGAEIKALEARLEKYEKFGKMSGDETRWLRRLATEKVDRIIELEAENTELQKALDMVIEERDKEYEENAVLKQRIREWWREDGTKTGLNKILDGVKE